MLSFFQCGLQKSFLSVFLDGDAVFYTTWKEEKVRQLPPFILTEDVPFNLFELFYKCTNRILSSPLQ